MFPARTKILMSPGASARKAGCVAAHGLCLNALLRKAGNDERCLEFGGHPRQNRNSFRVIAHESLAPILW